MRRAKGWAGRVVRHYPLAEQETHLKSSLCRDAGFVPESLRLCRTQLDHGRGGD
jgi:hypothetical protein